MNNPNDSKIFRRPIAAARNIADFDVEYFAHITRYERAAQLIIEESKRLGRPVRVLDIGCGEMWPLRTLISTFWVSKPAILKSYVGVDIEEQAVDFVGPKLHKAIDIRCVQQDLTLNPELPVARKTIDIALALESIEHMPKRFVRKWIEDLHGRLQQGAVIFISTPNRDYGREQPTYHGDYEWGYVELKCLLTKRWTLEHHQGTFMNRAVFRRVNRQEQRMPEQLVEALRYRLGPSAFRNVVAALYPEYSENVCWFLRKP